MATMPLVPAGVTATASAGLQVAIGAANASAQPAGTTYNLLRGNSPGNENAVPVASGIAALPCNYREAGPGQFYYALTATSGGQTSAASAEASAFAYNAASLPSNIASGTAFIAPPGPFNVPADPFVTIRLFLLDLLTLRPKMLDPAKLLPILDIVGASYRTTDLRATAAQLTGVGALIYGDGVAVYGTGNEKFILRMASAADGMVDAAQPDVVNRGIYNGFFTALNSYLSSQGSGLGAGAYSNLDGYLTALNLAAPYAALVSPNTAYLQWLYNSKQPTLLMQPANVYAPETTLGTSAVGAGAALTLTTASSIPTANDGTNGVQGYAPAPGVTAQVTADVGGTLSVTLTASGRNAQGQSVAGRTWTAHLDNLAAGQSAAFVPQVAGDRISQITAIAGQGSAGGGAFSLQTTTDRSAL